MQSNLKKIAVLAGCTAIVCIMLCSCSPHVQSKDSNDSGKDSGGIQVEWSPSADCSTCHSNEQESYDNSSCLASSHKNESCSSCHADEQALASAHEGKTSSDKDPSKLKATEVSDDQCLSCHYGTKEALINATQTVVVTDENGTSCNPHDPGDSVEHQTLNCANCHSMHSEESITEQALNTCIGCHHANVFECNTCHE